MLVVIRRVSIGTNGTIGTNGEAPYSNGSIGEYACKRQLVLRGWLIERGIFIIIINAFLLGVKANLFCMVGL